MNIDEFIRTIEGEFEDLPEGQLKPSTRFKELEEWNSMMALIIIARITDEYQVTITAEDLSGITTIEQLFHIVKERKGN